MATSVIPQARISHVSQGRIIEQVKHYLGTLTQLEQLRATFKEKDLAYYREQDRTETQRRALAANRVGDASKIQDPTVPVVGPQTETALASLVETFLSSYPIFPVVSKPQLMGEALQIETILGECAIQFQWSRHLSMAMRDGLKYNLMAVEVEWKDEKTSAVLNNPSVDMKYGTPTDTVFSGSQMKRIDPYNLLLDMRVAPCDVAAKGDFVGYNELLTRIQLKQLFLELDNSLTMNATEAFNSKLGGPSPSAAPGHNYYVPEVNPLVPISNTNGIGQPTNWAAWAGLEDGAKKIDYSEMYQVTTLYCRVIPKELGMLVKNPGTPQIYKFIIVNSNVVIYVERKTNAHNLLPIIVAQPIEDGLNYQTKSFADNATPYQQISSGLYKSAMLSQRRKVYDRIFYDPSRIKKVDIDRTDPVARIPVTTEAYGKPILEAFAVVPYRDDGVPNILAMAREVVDMADVSSGQNRVARGQFQKGNKTRFEVDQVMGNSDARPRMMALQLEVVFYQPIKHILKTNILQYQPAGPMYNRQQKKEVAVNPVELRKKVWEFQVADGALPSSKLINPELLGQAFQAVAAVPQMAAEWDIMGMFAYQMQLSGARWVSDFRRTPQQEQNVLNNQQVANGQLPVAQPTSALPVQ